MNYEHLLNDASTYIIALIFQSLEYLNQDPRVLFIY